MEKHPRRVPITTKLRPESVAWAERHVGVIAPTRSAVIAKVIERAAGQKLEEART